MAEKKIELFEIDPVEIFGVNDKLLTRLANYYPKLKVVARGNTIALKGNNKDIDSFQTNIDALIAKRHKKRSLNMDDVDQLFEESDYGIGVGGTTINTLEMTSEGLKGGFADEKSDIIVFGNDGKIVRARTKNQKKLVEEYYKNDLIFALGPAGTGKTYTAIALAVRALKNREVKKLILTRPAVEAGERLGFLPGDMQEKVDPYLRPLYDALYDVLGIEAAMRLREKGVIEVVPLAYMRGRTLDNAFIILDEAQNTTPEQMKMFLTRLGYNSKAVITGDLSQTDLPRGVRSGLSVSTSILSGIEGINIFEFTDRDVVRHPLVRKIIGAYDKFERESSQGKKYSIKEKQGR